MKVKIVRSRICTVKLISEYNSASMAKELREESPEEQTPCNHAPYMRLQQAMQAGQATR